MDIYIYDNAFNELGVLDSYISLIWRREYYKSGTFELHLYMPGLDEEVSSLISLLQKGNILVKEDDPVEAAYIENIILDDEEHETIIVSGYFINNFISSRIIWGELNVTGNVETVMKHFVNVNAVSPENPRRIIPNLTISPNKGISIDASEVNSYGNLAEKMEEFALKYDIGWRIQFDYINKQYVFDVFQGRDLSIEQSINPQSIFSLEYENVHKQTFTDSDIGYKNMALVAGQGEGTARKLVAINDQCSGFNRRELFVDAKDLPQKREDDSLIPDTEYENILTERGKSKLSEVQRLQTFEAGVSVTSNLIYKQDFDLGDKVTILNERWNVLLNTRITTIEEIYENNILDIRVNFGSNIPTLIDKIKQKMR